MVLIPYSKMSPSKSQNRLNFHQQKKNIMAPRKKYYNEEVSIAFINTRSFAANDFK